MDEKEKEREKERENQERRLEGLRNAGIAGGAYETVQRYGLLLRSIMWLTRVRTMKQEKHYPKA